MHAGLRTRGFETGEYVQHVGSDDAVRLARTFLERGAVLPDGLYLARLGPDTEPALISAAAELSLSQGVTPGSAAAIRGLSVPDGGMVICDDIGAVVATGAAYMCYAADSPRAKTYFWGMLATHKERRGQGLARYLGAALVQRMRDVFGADAFTIGVSEDNPVSAGPCSGLGVGPTDHVFVTCTDPVAFPDGKPTR